MSRRTHGPKSGKHTQPHRARGTRPARWLLGAITGLLVIWVIAEMAFGALLLACAVHLGGLDYVNVEGVSMEPTIHYGDAVIETAATSAKVGQVATFLDPAAVGGQVTHRIKAIASPGHRSPLVPGRNTTGQLSYVTRGDANNVADPFYRPANQLVGVDRVRVPLGGYADTYLHTTAGKVWCFIPFAALLLFWLLLRPSAPASDDLAVRGERSGSAETEPAGVSA